MSDPYYANVSLLLPMNGVNGGTTFLDLSPNSQTVTRFNATTSTGQSKYYGSSGYFDGSGYYLSVSNSTSMQMGSGDFTWEAWVRFASASVAYGVIDRRGAYAARGMGILIDSGVFRLYAGDSNTAGWEVSLASSTKAINTWYHVASTRASNIYRLFVDGAKVGESTWAGTVADDTSPTLIGRIYDRSDLSGYLQDVRITKNIARYTADFTPPDRLASMVSGTILDTDGNPCARTVYLYDNATGAKLAETASDGGTGGYAAYCRPGEVFRVVMANESTLYNHIIDRVNPG